MTANSPPELLSRGYVHAVQRVRSVVSICTKLYLGYHLLAGSLAILMLLLVTTGVLDGALVKVDAYGMSMNAASNAGQSQMLQLGLESFLLGIGGFALMHYLPKLWQRRCTR